MGDKIRSVRGMNDLMPDASGDWQYVEATVAEALNAYGYREMRVPLVERTELFSRSIGEATDVVEKEMYTFEDRGGESITLRPEGTAGCVRAAIAAGLLHQRGHRIWYAGPMFRYERPQKGRYRQFHQIGAEAYGFEGPDVDAELILAGQRMWAALGLGDVTLSLNSLGTPASRTEYRAVLTAYMQDHRAALDEDSLRRLESNPLRILDSKNPELAAVIAAAPAITEHLDTESAEHLTALRELLDAAGVTYRMDPRLVRGLDYYTRTVFEWTGTGLGAQDAICSGGRYDGLIEELGGKPTPAVGWALGLERLIAMVQQVGTAPVAPEADVYVVVADDSLAPEAVAVSESLRDALPGRRVITHCGGGSMKSQFKRADRSGAALAVIVAADEAAAGQVGLKVLRGDAGQETVARSALPGRVSALLADHG
jgi:histidyl-tRNA synthetase